MEENANIHCAQRRRRSRGALDGRAEKPSESYVFQGYFQKMRLCPAGKDAGEFIAGEHLSRGISPKR
jgi:hypothetical protein